MDPADLAAAAREAIVLPEPVVSHNPALTKLNGGTLVRLPTWFWVDDPASLGGDGTVTLRAEAPSGTGTAWAEATATTTGLTVSSPAGRTTCSSGQAVTAWAPSVNEADACTLAFTRAHPSSTRGWPVTTSVNWTATWSGSDGTTNAALSPLTRQATTTIAVGEIQAVVTDVD